MSDSGSRRTSGVGKTHDAHASESGVGTARFGCSDLASGLLQSFGDFQGDGDDPRREDQWRTTSSAGGEAGSSETLGYRFSHRMQRFSDPPPSASRPPHRIEIAITILRDKLQHVRSVQFVVTCSAGPSPQNGSWPLTAASRIIASSTIA